MQKKTKSNGNRTDGIGGKNKAMRAERKRPLPMELMAR